MEAQKEMVFEVKVAGVWKRVRATTMVAVHTWCLKHKAEDWRLTGTLSWSELRESKNYPFVG